MVRDSRLLHNQILILRLLVKILFMIQLLIVLLRHLTSNGALIWSALVHEQCSWRLSSALIIALNKRFRILIQTSSLRLVGSTSCDLQRSLQLGAKVFVCKRRRRLSVFVCWLHIAVVAVHALYFSLIFYVAVWVAKCIVAAHTLYTVSIVRTYWKLDSGNFCLAQFTLGRFVFFVKEGAYLKDSLFLTHYYWW